jgi:general secretion pathway protein H
MQPLSPRLALSITTVSGDVAGQRAGITFAPDGSSSGGRVAMAEGGRRVLVGVDWLTGRVSVANVE